MKKSFAIFALTIAAAFSATAADLSPFTKYEYNNFRNSGVNTQELQVGVALPTTVGTFDAAVALDQRSGKASGSSTGFETGYTINGFKAGPVDFTARAAVGRKNFTNAAGKSYWSLEAKAVTPITTTVDAFIGYRHRQVFSGPSEFTNRYTVGVSTTLTKGLIGEVGYAYTRASGNDRANGLVASLNYKF